MRLGVLDIGSNTGHLLVVDAHAGGAPVAASSVKEPLRLAEHLTDSGAVAASGVEALVAFCAAAVERAEDLGCEEVTAFATSAVRDATNVEDVLAAVRDRTGLALSVLSGENEARLTFLAVRRWFGWSSGRLAVLDIGGGSLEIAVGADEAPDVARSLPLGAGRLTRDHLGAVPPAAGEVRELRRRVRAAIARDAGEVLRAGPVDHAVATSKTFRSLARVCGAAPSAEGTRVRRVLRAAALEEWVPRLETMALDELSDLPGVSAARAHQLLAGALVASAAMDILGFAELEICPWALREGILLERLDKISLLG